MKRIHALATTVFLSIFLAVAVNAAPGGTSKKADIPQGLKNAKKVVQHMIERDKKMHQKINKGQAKKEAAKNKKGL